jgi:uncharacterized membrane protein YphA (DoxX/SURF4 family)
MKSGLGIGGRVLFGLPLLVFAMMHLAKSEMMAGRVLVGWPGAQVLVIVSGLGMLAAALSILSGRMTRLAGMLLAAEMLIIVVGVHVRGAANAVDEQAKTISMVQIFKDTMIAGGALAIAALAGQKDKAG